MMLRIRYFAFLAVPLAALIGLVLAAKENAPEPASREAQWKKVEAAIKKGLPQTAVKELEPIIESAMKDKAYPEAVKAIAKKIALEGNVQGNKPEEKVTRMEAEFAKAPAEMKPVMQAILADWYWHYFTQNRYRFMRRTATSAPPGKDFTTWDLPRLFAEIDKHFQIALAAEKELKSIKIESYDMLLTKGGLPDKYRPTLYDFIAFEALQFYGSGEQAGAMPSDAFEIDANSPLLGSRAEFLAWKPETTDSDSPKLKAIKLYQALLTFHAADADKSALLDADLHRLRYAFNTCYGEAKKARYNAALKAFAEANADHETSAHAREMLARQVWAEGDAVAAHAIAKQGANAFPNSPGGKLCKNVIFEIEAKNVNMTTERVWNAPQPMIRVDSRNVSKAWFRAVKVDWVSRVGRDRWRAEYLDNNDRANLLKQKADLEWSHDLPNPGDYSSQSSEFEAPKTLKPGFYFIIASCNEKFTDKENQISVAPVWVSDLAIVQRQDYAHGKAEGFVLNAISGEPINGATIKAWTRNPNGNGFLPVDGDHKTDGNGLFSIPGNQRSYVILASHEGHQLASANEIYTYSQRDNYRPQTQTVIFTDRSLYRPGQTIHFKGISLMANQKDDDYKVLANRKLTVVFYDVNHKEITKQQFTTNEFGSFSGQVTAPRDRLMGRMTLLVPNEAGGTSFNVEEYKRPKFQVELEAPKEAAKLNGPVTVNGKATSYTGSAVNGAKVRFRVTRQPRWPAWYWGYYAWRMPQNTDAQEIAFGTATTEADGTFKITFTAKPDLSITESDGTYFHFNITADVTDTTGETRSDDKGINVGTVALQASMSLDDWQVADKDVKLTVSTQSLDNEPRAAKGTVKIHKLKEPEKVQRPSLTGRPNPTPRRGKGGRILPVAPPKPDPSNPMTWELGEVVATLDFATDASGSKELSAKLEAGMYRAVLETADQFGKPVNGKTEIRVLKPEEAKLSLKVPELFAAPKWRLEPGEEFLAIWGTGYESGRAYVEIEHRGKIVQSYWTEPGKTQIAIKQKIDETMRGGFHVRTTFVKENRGYFQSRHIDVPWTNKDLTVKWERFVSKLEPAKKETFTATVTGPKATKAVAEMVAALYDASLDAYLPHNWMSKFNVFRQDFSRMNSYFENYALGFSAMWGQWDYRYITVDLSYRAYPHEISQNLWGYGYYGRGGGGGLGGIAPATAAPMAEEKAMAKSDADAVDGLESAESNRRMRKNGEADKQGGPGEAGGGPKLEGIAARKNLSELAFFFPQLRVNDDGSVKMEFTMPETLTKWKFLGFIHDKELKSGSLTGEMVTAKDLMVQPNPPRFLREGDKLEFSVKVSNQSPTKQQGKVRLTILDARTLKPLDAEFGINNGEEREIRPASALNKNDQSFEVNAGESKSYFWTLSVPDGVGPVVYKVVGATDRLGDGEEGVLPVLSKRILVQESLPLPIRGEGTKTFDFAKLKASGQSKTLQTQSLTVQMVSQPAWYAVMALPYLMEYPHECSEQTFNRVYANALARHIATSDPKIRRIFDLWKNTPALDSPLSKNQDLKAVMLEETPWVRDADKESEARRNVGILFDDNRLSDEVGRGMMKLAQMQKGNGAWPWFPGGPDNEYLTLYITTGFGRLRHLGAKVDIAPAVKALTHLDGWMDERYKWILAHSKNPEDNHLSTTVALYLYGRSFFLADKPVAKQHQAALDYWKRQAKNHWLKLANRQSQAHLAIGLKRMNELDAAKGIMASIKERSVSNEELGMFWRDTELSYWWYHAPIETQAMMIEAFDEVMNDAKAVEDCKVWMLKQKQTQNWKTTKATADAVYGLLLRGNNLLSSDALVAVKLGGTEIKPQNVEAGTGFYEQKFLRGEVKPEMGQVTVTKTDPGVSWGSVHWSYLEDISKVTPHEGTPLKLEKKLFKRTYTKKGPVLEEVKGAVDVGDEIVVRVVLRTDRDMEYCHMKDHRGSGTEPVNVISQYKFQDGLYYYESTKDTATHFFIDYLPKGVYVFEYAVRVQHRGMYPMGLAHIECMYAPEFNSHSESMMLEAK